MTNIRLVNAYTSRPERECNGQRVWDAVVTGMVYESAWVNKCGCSCDVPYDWCVLDAACPGCGAAIKKEPAYTTSPPASGMASQDMMYDTLRHHRVTETSGLAYALRHRYDYDGGIRTVTCSCGTKMVLCPKHMICACVYPAVKNTEDII